MKNLKKLIIIACLFLLPCLIISASAWTIVLEDVVVESISKGGISGNSIVVTSQNEKQVEIDSLDELFSTVYPSDFDMETLTKDKLVAVVSKEFVTKTISSSKKLEQWPLVKYSDSDEHINDIIEGINSGFYGVLEVEHKAEVFMIETIYSNVDSHIYRTRVSITVTAPYNVNGLRIVELIPKSVASSIGLLTFKSETPTVIEKDPMVEWTVDSLNAGESVTFSYYAKERIESDGFETVAIHNLNKAPVIEQPAEIVPEPEPEPEPKPAFKWPGINIQWIWMLVIIIAGEGIVLGFFGYKGLSQTLKLKHLTKTLKAKSESEHIVIRPGVVIPYSKVRDVEKFIETEVRAGKRDNEIRHALISIGWEPHTIDIIMHDVHVVDSNVGKLDGFIKACFDKGLTADHVRTTLINVGWREDIVDLVLDDFR